MSRWCQPSGHNNLRQVDRTERVEQFVADRSQGSGNAG